MSSPPTSTASDFDVQLRQTPMSGASSPQPGTSTAASSPPPNAMSDYSCASSEVADSMVEADRENLKEQEDNSDPLSLDELDTTRRLERLQFVLKQSAVYSSILGERMEEEKAKQRARREQKAGSKRGRLDNPHSLRSKKKKKANGEAVSTIEEPVGDTDHGFQQPALVTGARLKPYQLDGLQWMVSLDKNGISGILADEMGLGKTLQTIAFSAYLREQGHARPFLVVCPLSVLHNWVDEYAKFAPTIPVCMYHGTPEHRKELRQTVMSLSAAKLKHHKPKPKPAKRKAGRPRKSEPAEEVQTEGPVLRRSKRPRKSTVVIESEEEDELAEPEPEYQEPTSMDTEEDSPEPEEISAQMSKFPIVITTYDIIMNDRVHLQQYNWGYIVVDEGHRLKNMNCKLMQEIKKYTSAGRMILTGTPLHNNLAELWSLLNFILPDIFDDLDSFQEWFNLPALQSSLPTSQSSQIISSLHAILKPFLLRRLKVDVEMNLPPKKEYVLYAPLSVRQREAYDCVLNGGLRQWLIQDGPASASAEPEAEALVKEVKPEQVHDADEDEQADTLRVSKRFSKGGRKNYAVDGDDDKYFEMLERGELDERGLVKVKVIKSKEEEEAEEARIGREYQVRLKVKQVNNMRLQNIVMQLRKVCSHPFLFDWPIDPKTSYPVLGEELLNASGKMMVLDRLLRELFKRGHKVLLFSQFTTMLNIIEEWAVHFMGWEICRIDGSTKALDRREQMNRFQTGGDDPKAPCLFLLSTRAGGLGINLVAADTVIFYDQDWNPQMDAQAQDRAHRIGQTRPVLIFRLVSAHTVETNIMECAAKKRKLEALVIAKGKFKMPAAAASTKKVSMAEMAAALLRLEGEKIEVVPNTEEGKQSVLSDADLDTLLDRRPEVFAERVQGWTSSETAEAVSDQTEATGKKATFAVYQAPVEEGNDALAKMLGEDEAD